MNILIVAAHADDESFGAGGLIPILINGGHNVKVILASDGNITARGEGIHNINAFEKAMTYFGVKDIAYLMLEDQYFDKYYIADIANMVGKHSNDPDIIISHVSTDLNKDHCIISEAAKIIGRPKKKPISILGMEIANTSVWNGNVFHPDLYVDITGTIEQKKQAFSYYVNELREFPYPYSIKGIEVLAQYRGMESGTQFAEAYKIYRIHNIHLKF